MAEQPKSNENLLPESWLRLLAAQSEGSKSLAQFANLLPKIDTEALLSSAFPKFDADLAANAFKATLLSQFNSEKSRTETDINELKKKLAEIQGKADKSEEELEEYQRTVEELKNTEQLYDVLFRIRDEAHAVLKQDAGLSKKFTEGTKSDMYVVSMDLRRSTELMLKARDPRAFADFIGELCIELMDTVKSLDGVVDKFTGDGVLAYFPDFFTGSPSSANVIELVDSAHEIFDRTYRKYHGAFKTILNDVGVGIGVDYGSCQVVRIGGSVSIVGEPVVYACRFASAPAGSTYFNRVGYEAIVDEQADSVVFEEVITNIKHEGSVTAYKLRGHAALNRMIQPAWQQTMVSKEVESSSGEQQEGSDNSEE